MFYIYKITNLKNGKIYIGKSKNKNRWSTHLKISRGGKIKYPRLFFAIHAAIKKYGENTFSFEKEKETYDTEDQAFEAEKFAIYNYKLQGFILYNLTEGGEGSSGAKRSVESRKKMSLAHQKDSYINSTQKLSIQEVKNIKKLLTANSLKMKEIAELFSVSFETISSINNGITWSWVIDPNFIKAKRIPNRKLSETDVKNIRELLSQKISYRKIASQFNVSVACIQKIKNGKTFILK